MAKIYTALDFRYEAEFQEGCHGKPNLIATMLRQAADALERKEKSEKKYEYTVKYRSKDGSCDIDEFHSDTQDEAEIYAAPFDGDTFVVLRRPVGKWEEVKK